MFKGNMYLGYQGMHNRCGMEIGGECGVRGKPIIHPSIASQTQSPSPPIKNPPYPNHENPMPQLQAMNDEPSASASTAPRSDDRENVDTTERPLTAKEIAERRKKNRDNFNRKRSILLEDLLRQLDILVFAELSAIYYME